MERESIYYVWNDGMINDLFNEQDVQAISIMI